MIRLILVSSNMKIKYIILSNGYCTLGKLDQPVLGSDRSPKQHIIGCIRDTV